MITIKICWSIFKDAIFHSRWSKISSIFTTIGLFISISGLTVDKLFGWEWFEQIPKHIWWFLIVCCLILIILRVLWISALKIEEHSFSEKELYTPVKLIRKIKDISTIINQHNAQEKTVVETLDSICNKLREIFDKLTDSSCCVSVKIIEGPKNGDFDKPISEILNFKVHNIAHDNHHKSRRETEDYNNTEHFIRENTAFFTVVGKLGKSGKLFYLNNDVNISNGYTTSSPYKDENGNSTNPPYKSELVFPIYKIKDNQIFSFLGFLCIDSDKKESFSKEDVAFEIGMMYSDILYNILPSYN